MKSDNFKAKFTQRNGVWGLEDYKRWRPFLPDSLLESVVKEIHLHPLAAHPGAARMRSIVALHYVANVTEQKMRDILKRCVLCLQRKPPIPQHGLLKSAVPECPWRTVAMDFAGPYPMSDGGYRYVLAFVDQFTKWVELVATTDQTAPTVVKAFYERIICQHGCPLRLLSDNGPAFRAKLVEALCAHFSVKKIFATAYYPQGDGYAERFMRTLNNSLSALTAHTGEKWADYLCGVAFGYNIAEHTATGVSPFELNRGRLPYLPMEG